MKPGVVSRTKPVPIKRGKKIRMPARSVDSGDLKRELALARKAARAAGEILRKHWRRGGYKIGSKGKAGPVTEADLEADRALKKLLHDPFPQYGWLSEETADDGARFDCRRVWIVDPLDGTREFIKGIPELCVAVALVEDGQPVLGVTYNPIRREMFWAARGTGCHLNAARVRVTRTRALSNATVLASRSETGRGEWEDLGEKFNVIPTGSVAYKLALVAAGKADATFTRSPKSEWDIASGAALLKEAGGTMTDIHGNALRFNQWNVKVAGMIADNAVLHEQLVKIAPQQKVSPPRAAKVVGARERTIGTN